MRLDKWLWAARFFKTRSLATQAVNGGRVHLDGERTKPSKELRPGSTLKITRGELTYVVIVRDVSDRRGPASTARLLYEETPESVAARERMIAFLKATALPDDRTGRPSKRDRRRLDKLKGR